MFRPYSKLFSAAAAVLVALGGSAMLAAPPASAEPVTLASAHGSTDSAYPVQPLDLRLQGTWGSLDDCQQVGDRGRSHHMWNYYVCVPWLNGWNLWVA
jgi:hypothetical protein